MDNIHFDDFGLVLLNGKNYELMNLSKKCKTRTLTSQDGFKLKIDVSSIRISPRTYWIISGRYDHQFNGHDANCWLCGWYGIDYSSCQCPVEGFTIEQHLKNIIISRRNYVKILLKSNWPEYLDVVDNLTDKQIDELLYSDSKDCRKLMLTHPKWNNRESEIASTKAYLDKKISQF